MKATIILPTYNEIENIEYLIRAINTAVKDEKEILIVDDNSPDGTSRAVQDIIDAGEVPNVRLIKRLHNKGLANSIRDGISQARGDVVVWMDCDFSMPPDIIPSLLVEIDRGCDIAVGSRFVTGGSFKKNTADSQDSWVAVVLSRGLNVFIRVLLGGWFKDYTSGFIAARKNVFEKVQFGGDYGEYFMEIILRAHLYNFKIVEIPYVCLPRARGQSKTGTNMKQYMRRGLKYVRTAFRLLWIRLKYDLFRVIDA